MVIPASALTVCSRVMSHFSAARPENLIVAQLHIAFLRFHNAVVDWLQANNPPITHETRGAMSSYSSEPGN